MPKYRLKTQPFLKYKQFSTLKLVTINTFLRRIMRGIILCEKNHTIPFKKIHIIVKN